MTPLTPAWMTLLALFVRAGARRAGGRGTVGRGFTLLAVSHTAPLVALMRLPDMAGTSPGSTSAATPVSSGSTRRPRPSRDQRRHRHQPFWPGR